MGNFHYTTMPFGLKNACATYQCALTAIFHNMLHGCLKDFVDQIVVKWKNLSQHIDDLSRDFTWYRKYNFRMNSSKCAFRGSSRKFLGFTIYKKNIDLDVAKAKAIMDMEPPKTTKQLTSFLGRVSYIRRFIPALGELLEQFQKLLKKVGQLTRSDPSCLRIPYTPWLEHLDWMGDVIMLLDSTISYSNASTCTSRRSLKSIALSGL